MQTRSYRFREEIPEAQRDQFAITLRKHGFFASMESDELRTNATLSEMAMQFGCCLGIIPNCGRLIEDPAWSHKRLACSCGRSVWRRSWMSDGDWEAAKASFRFEHAEN